MQRPQRLQRDKKSSSSSDPGGRSGFELAGRDKNEKEAPATTSALPERRISRRVKKLPVSAFDDELRTMSNCSAGHISLQRPHARQLAVVRQALGAAAPVGQTFSQRPQWMQVTGGFTLKMRQRDRNVSSRPVGQIYTHQNRGKITSPKETSRSNIHGICCRQMRESSSVSKWNGVRYTVQPLPRSRRVNKNKNQGPRHVSRWCTQAGGAPVFFLPIACRTETFRLCSTAKSPPKGHSQPQKKRPNRRVRASVKNGNHVQVGRSPMRR